MSGYKRHIPKNSFNIMMVFKDDESMRNCMKNSEFQKAQSALANIALSYGAEVKTFTNPK